MINFTDLPKRNKAYSGANGSKLSVIYDNEVYMLKFPPYPTINKELSYTNSCISEYIGCKIFESIGIPVQKTLLGTYNFKGKEKIVVACKDFTSVGIVLQDFASLKNRLIDSVRNGYGTELSEILTTFDEQTSIDKAELKNRFWDMFIVDALIGNWDRHNGNWGFLYNETTDEITLAPVFDCGSSLYPQADEETIKEVLADKKAVNHRIYNIPLSSIQINGKKINYFNFISSIQNEDCNDALRRIFPRIDINEINRIVDETPYISDLQKTFYKHMLTKRKELILDYAFNLLNFKK